MNSLDTCTSSRPRLTAGLLTVLVVGWTGCGLISIDPDEIDYHEDDAADEVGQDSDTGDADEGFESGTDESNEESTTGDATDDDGPLDADTSDGTSDETDVDTNADDSSDTAASDGTTTGDMACETSGEVEVAENPVEVADGMSLFDGSCGGSGSETLYSFTAPADGDYQFSLAGADFSAILYLADEECAEFAESCSNNGDPILRSMLMGDTVVVVVDSDGGIGTATLLITGP